MKYIRFAEQKNLVDCGQWCFDFKVKTLILPLLAKTGDKKFDLSDLGKDGWFYLNKAAFTASTLLV